ncbi:hypothetical protein MTR67_029120 [Solanum verrucosum]|uniref:FRIGIDA-like protein n=1 Tax=Solanum verrucosum TaxID=315347 RepID=A0AAF0R7D9_SOLVR|nr:hypothetical protein MTR67_029120 [Solanum verrucosum]
MEYIPKLIQWGVKGNVINAIDIAYTFGFEEKLEPLGLLTSFLKESEETLSKKIKGFKQTITVRAAKKRYLFDLKSVYGCLKRHRIDPSKLVPGWQFNEELAELVKDIRDQKMAQKRKIDETESSGCFSNKEMKNSYFPNPWPPHQQKVVNHVDNSNTTLLEGGGAGGHIYGYSLAPSVLHAPGVHGLNLVDSTPGQIGSHTGQLCGRLGDAIVYDRLASHSYAYRPLSYLEASTRLPNTITGDAYKPPPYLETYTGFPNTIPADAYRPPP